MPFAKMLTMMRDVFVLTQSAECRYYRDLVLVGTLCVQLGRCGRLCWVLGSPNVKTLHVASLRHCRLSLSLCFTSGSFMCPFGIGR